VIVLLNVKRSLSPREELLKIQKKIFAQNDAFIRGQESVRQRGFDLYERQYKRRVRHYEKVSTQEELLEAILKSDIVYLGDYHTNNQSQRTLLRLLKLMVEKIPDLGLGLELVSRKHQKFLDAYLAEKISEETFLEKIRFRKYWYFDLWQNFKPIFDFARFHHLPVFAIEWSLAGEAPLQTRDRKSAGLIASVLKTDPKMKLVVFAGDLHVAPEHLPREVQRELKKNKDSKKELIVYQNSESIYWELAEDGVEDKVEIVRISDREFCIINTPPIVWQQSYLNWLEHDEGSIDWDDAKHSFLVLLKQIADFLGIPIPPESEEVEVFTCGDLSFLKKLSDDGSFSKKEILQIKKQILASESYCIPQKKCVYLANLSLNHASEEAAHYLKFLCSGEEAPRDPVDAFYANTLHEALGFFGSKIINHKRKCFHEKEYRGLVEYLRSAKVPRSRKQELEIALLVLEHRELDKKGISVRSRKYFKSRPDLFFGVTHGLGYMLGDRLYYALLAEKVSKEEIREAFCDPMKEPGAPFLLYKKLLNKVRGVKLPKRV
jgi:hypothetical protein